MSAFVVSPETMHKAVLGIARTEHPMIGNVFGVDRYDYDSLGRILYSLNIEAIQQRYPDTVDQPGGIPGPIDPETDLSIAPELPRTYRHSMQGATGCKIAQYKALQCLIYQCAEGNVPETAQWKALRDFERMLADMIISELPEYEKAAWDD